MSAVLGARVALLLLALVSARRARSARGMALAGASGAAAAFGPGPLPLPPAILLGAVLLGVALLLALLRSGLHPPLASEAAWQTLGLAACAAAPAGAALRGAGPEGALLGAIAVAAALSVHGAGACLANVEAGWRRGAGWTGAVLLPGLVAGGLVVLGERLPPRVRAFGPVLALLVALLAWLAPFLLERRRVLAELSEEARLGILPAEDLAVLGNPWRRAREPRLGRADERREYVRSALLLAVARQQQRRRSGEAIRLRQLEVLAFRTRVRRAVAGRASRFEAVADEAPL